MPPFLALLLAASSFASDRIARTSLGEIRGSSANGTVLFPFIAYAEPPVGARRWRPSLPAKRARQREAPVQCPQVLEDYLPGASLPESEDCLYLNVWAPENAANAPVIFFIHGGGLLTGSGLKPLYDGSVFARRGFVFVSINYRLGELGFGPSLDPANGSLGLLDQGLALSWVEKNIAAFGGNPHHVYLLGHSKGAEAVTALAISGLAGEGVLGGVALSGPRHFDGVGAPKPGFYAGERNAPAREILGKLGRNFYVPQLPERRGPLPPAGTFRLLVSSLYDETIGGQGVELYCANLHFLEQFPAYLRAWHYVWHSPTHEHGHELTAIFREEPFGLRMMQHLLPFFRDGEPPKLWYGHRPRAWAGTQEETHVYPSFSFSRNPEVERGKGNDYFTKVRAICEAGPTAGSRISGPLFTLERWLRWWRGLFR